MKQEIDDYLRSKIAAEKDYQEEWGAHRYLIRGKMFAMHSSDKDGKEILTLKLKPGQGEELRELYAGTVVPGYYMNKAHWNSIYLANDFADDLLKKLIDESHALVLDSFSKKMQREILEEK